MTTKTHAQKASKGHPPKQYPTLRKGREGWGTRERQSIQSILSPQRIHLPSRRGLLHTNGSEILRENRQTRVWISRAR